MMAWRSCQISPWTLIRRKRYVFYCILFAALFVLTPLFYDVGLLKRKPLLLKHKARKQQDLTTVTGRGVLREHHAIASSPRHFTGKPASKIAPSMPIHNTDKRKTARNVHLSIYKNTGDNVVLNTEKEDNDGGQKVGSRTLGTRILKLGQKVGSRTLGTRVQEFGKAAPLTTALNRSVEQFSPFYHTKYSLQRIERPLRMLESLPEYKTIDSTKPTTQLPNERSSFHETLAQSRSGLARGHGQPKKLAVVILALMRTGSSFVSEFFNSHFDFFYLFEPMWTLKHHDKYFFKSKGPDIVHEGKGIRVNRFDREYKSLYQRAKLQMLTGIFHCNFTGLAQFFSSYLRGVFIGRDASRTVKDSCRTARFRARTGNGSDCPVLIRHIPRVMTDLCRRHKHAAVKTIRVDNVGELMPLVEDPSLDLKILHLIRDPRAIVASRLSLSHPAAVRSPVGLQELLIRTQEVDEICGWMERNVQYRDQLPRQLQGRYALVRYEDVAADPSNMAEKIYKFLGIPMPAEVTGWIDKNTKGRHHITSRYQTNRNSRATLDTWRRKLVFSSVTRVQNRCNDIMTKLGYRPAQNLEELTNMTNILIEEPSTEIANLII